MGFLSKVGDFFGITGDGSSSPGGGIPGLWDRYKNGQTNTYNARMNSETNQYNERIARETNLSNEKIAKDTNQLNKEIAEQNLAFQRENLDYQKALQEKIFQREDSSYARTVQDMRQAGMSPLVMSGTNGAGEAIATQALNNQMQYQPWKNERWEKQAFQMQNAGGVLDFMSSLLNVANAREDVASKKLANKYAEDTLDSRVDAQKIETRIKQCEEAIKAYEQSDGFRKNLYNQFYNIHEGMTPDERNNAIINRLFSESPESEFMENGFDNYNKDLKSKTKSYSALKAGSGVLEFLKGLF